MTTWFHLSPRSICWAEGPTRRHLERQMACGENLSVAFRRLLCKPAFLSFLLTQPRQFAVWLSLQPQQWASTGGVWSPTSNAADSVTAVALGNHTRNCRDSVKQMEAKQEHERSLESVATNQHGLLKLSRSKILPSRWNWAWGKITSYVGGGMSRIQRLHPPNDIRIPLLIQSRRRLRSLKCPPKGWRPGIKNQSSNPRSLKRATGKTKNKAAESVKTAAPQQQHTTWCS